jgi:hypothetical protein
MAGVRNRTGSGPIVDTKTFSSQEGNEIVREKNVDPVMLICMINNREVDSEGF